MTSAETEPPLRADPAGRPGGPARPGAAMAVVRTLACLLALGAVSTSPLSAQQWPTRSIRIVTGTPAGGSPDFVSRLLAERLSERLGQAVVVENSATTGVAAWNTVAKSPPDGYLISM